jgi:hypothetical protein
LSLSEQSKKAKGFFFEMLRRLITLTVVLLVGARTAAAVSFTYQWRRCDTGGASCANIVGATAKTYTLTSADVGNRLRVRVRASNSAGASTALSLATAVVGTTPPKSLSLHAGRSTVVYGGAVNLFGSVANGQPGESVTITEQRVPAFSGVNVQTAATVQTTSDDTFNVVVHPIVHALYRASSAQTASNTISINVRPRLILSRVGSHRFALQALAARSFVGRSGVVQRFSVRAHRWISLRRVFFTRAFQNVSPTITSRAVFRARLGGARIRVFVASSQLTPGYVSGVSNVARA